MIEQGLVQLIQSGIGSLSPGGWATQLPKDLIGSDASKGQVLKAWTWKSITSSASYDLSGQDGFTGWQVQIDCHGNEAADAIALARAIDGVLRGGYSGTLSDPDNTVVVGIFRQGAFVDGYSDTNRSYVRTLEYLVNYQQI